MAREKQEKNSKLRHLEYYDLQLTFDKLYADSCNNKMFKNLYSIIICDENIKLAYRNIKRNSGSVTSGTDGITVKDIERIPLDKFVAIVKKKFQRYKPKTVKRVEIPKPNGKTRPLGIPAMWDRVVQQCILQVLEPICEAKFHERSNGFRPNRSAEHAISQAGHMIQRSHLHYVVDIDIKGFFDNVNHTKLIKQMWRLGIQDKKLICIIKEMLKAPILLPNGEITMPNIDGKKTIVAKDRAKTKSSLRALPLNEDLKDRLIEIRKQQGQYQKKFKRSYDKKWLDYVMVGDGGADNFCPVFSFKL